MSAEIIKVSEEEWAAMEAGPWGRCPGCAEPNQFCQCEDCTVCGGRHDPGYGCPGARKAEVA